MTDIRLYQGDLFEECKRIKDNSIDAIITGWCRKATCFSYGDIRRKNSSCIIQHNVV